MTRKRVVVIGGGFAGLRVARELPPSEMDVTLVDSKDFFENTPAALRCMVDPSAAARNLVKYPAKFNHTQGVAVGITSDGRRGTVQLQSGEELPFDYAVIAAGSSYPGSCIKPSYAQATPVAAREDEFRQAHAAIAAAGSVAIVGGGSVGVELAAEVVDTWPGKTVTLVTSAPRLLERMTAAASDYCTAWLEARDVQVLCGERIADWGGLGAAPGPATLTTASGRTISADWVVRAIGQKAASAPLAASLGKERLASHGAVLVEPTLQVKGLANVFAAGDITATDEEKTAYHADLQGMVAAHNILRLERGQGLQSYPRGLFGGLFPAEWAPVGGVSLGRRDGVFQAGARLQRGRGTAAMRWLVETITLRAAAGSWLFGRLSNLMKASMVKMLSGGAAPAAGKVGAGGSQLAVAT